MALDHSFHTQIWTSKKKKVTGVTWHIVGAQTLVDWNVLNHEGATGLGTFILKGVGLGSTVRFRELSREISPSSACGPSYSTLCDMPLGKHWRKLSPKHRSAWYRGQLLSGLLGLLGGLRWSKQTCFGENEKLIMIPSGCGVRKTCYDRGNICWTSILGSSLGQALPSPRPHLRTE